jgi:hypothetical protein
MKTCFRSLVLLTAFAVSTGSALADAPTGGNPRPPQQSAVSCVVQTVLSVLGL